jgi:hypothetical protein
MGARMNRAQAIRMVATLGAAGVGAAAAASRAGAASFGKLLLGRARQTGSGPRLRDGGMMGTGADMSAYMELFDRHRELRRTVHLIPGGVRTLTESDSPELVAQLQAHVAAMYDHLEQGLEVTCMSQSLPVLFRHASSYRRRFQLTEKGVAVTETSSDPRIVKAIREHAREVTGFVHHGMAAMMGGGAMAG